MLSAAAAIALSMTYIPCGPPKPLNAVFGGKLVSTQSIQQMKPVGDADFGFATQSISIDDWNGLGHGGNIDAFASNLVYFEDSDVTFAISCNGSNYGTHDISIAVLSEIFGKPYTTDYLNDSKN